MPTYLIAIFYAALFGLFGQVLKKIFPILCRYHIPRAFLGGILALLSGPQILGHISDISIIDSKVLDHWGDISLTFVNIVFASIFIGRNIPSLKDIIKYSAPQAALGQTLAWGQYATGTLITIFILVPFFDVDQSAASLIEISFQGGIGVAVGMKKTFDEIQAPQLADLAVAMAPMAMLTGILSGIFLINKLGPSQQDQGQDRDDDEDLVYDDQKEKHKKSNSLLIQIALIGGAIGIGSGILELLKLLESKIVLGFLYEDSLVRHIPVFPMALIGGLIIQFFSQKIYFGYFVNREVIQRIQSFALDLIIIMAIGGIPLASVGNQIGVFMILLGGGFLWTLGSFLFLYKKIIPNYSFQRGIPDYGQSMGTTSIGLMLFSLVDPNNKSHGKEAFGFKQLFFEPFLGGGLITAISPLLIHRLGLWTFFAISAGLTLLFLGFGLFIRRYYY